MMTDLSVLSDFSAVLKCVSNSSVSPSSPISAAHGLCLLSSSCTLSGAFLSAFSRFNSVAAFASEVTGCVKEFYSTSVVLSYAMCVRTLFVLFGDSRGASSGAVAYAVF